MNKKNPECYFDLQVYLLMKSLYHDYDQVIIVWSESDYGSSGNSGHDK